MKHLFNSTKCLSQEQLENYLNDNISREEQFRIENHLLDCELCAAAVEGFSQMSMQTEDLDFLKNFSSELEGKIPVQKEAIVRDLKPRRSARLRSIAAAAAMLLLPISIFLYQLNSDISVGIGTDDFIVSNDTRGIKESAAKDADLKNALDNFEEKYFEASVPQFEAYLERAPEDAEAMLYAGIASLESELYQKADDLLTTVRINEERLFEDATWYLILTKIKVSKTAEAVNLLDELLKKNKEGFYAKEARNLLKKIKK